MCRVLQVSRSGFYAWLERPESNRSKNEKDLLEKIREIHKRNRERYGRRRIYEGLIRSGTKVGKGTVGRIMHKHGIRPWYVKKFKRLKVEKFRKKVSPNKLNRDFKPGIPNKVWLSDLTQIRTLEGWLYISVVEDLGTRRVIGWSMSSRMKKAIILEGLRMALKDRKPPKRLMFHSDQGSQFRSDELLDLLKVLEIESSMSRKGNCWDNAPMESFFATLKRELYLETKWTRAKVKTEVFEFIEAFYNQFRYHSTLGYLTPVEYENQIQPRRVEAKRKKG